MKTKLLALALTVVLVSGCPPPPTNGTPTFENVTVEEFVKFGDGQCRIGIEPGLTGLSEIDPAGLRLLRTPNTPGRLLFGPTDDCLIEVNPAGPAGLLLRDPAGIRLLNPNQNDDATLFFGPTDLCAIKIRPQGPDGLWFCDPNGVRVINPLGDELPTRLLFGPEELCLIEVDPLGPGGLILRDPNGVRVWNPVEEGPDRIVFGPDDLCRIEVDPNGAPGLLLYDPAAIRVCNPIPDDPVRLAFGPEDLCRIELIPTLPGLRLTDPNGIRIIDPTEQMRPRLIFGPDDDCFIEAQPQLGIRINDPDLLRITAPRVEVAGIVVAEAFTTRDLLIKSSRDMKKNIKPLANALETIGRLEGVSFQWNDAPEGNTEIGFVAEDVAEVLPEVVGRDDNNEIQGLKYPNLVAVTVEGIKEQQHQIQALHEENRALKESLAAVQQQVAQMAEVLAGLQAQ